MQSAYCRHNGCIRHALLHTAWHSDCERNNQRWRHTGTVIVKETIKDTKMEAEQRDGGAWWERGKGKCRECRCYSDAIVRLWRVQRGDTSWKHVHVPSTDVSVVMGDHHVQAREHRFQLKAVILAGNSDTGWKWWYWLEMVVILAGCKMDPELGKNEMLLYYSPQWWILKAIDWDGICG